MSESECEYVAGSTYDREPLFVYVYVHHAILSIYYTFFIYIVSWLVSGVLWTRTGKYGLHLFNSFHFPKQQLGSQIGKFVENISGIFIGMEMTIVL